MSKANRKSNHGGGGAAAGARSVTEAMAAASFLAGDAGRPDGLNSTGPAGEGLTMEELVRRSNYWRDNYNPLRGLTIARLMALFEQAERGAFAEIQLTLRKAEKRFPVLKGFVEKLLSSVEELDGTVRVKAQLPAGATAAMAEAQRAFLQGRYDLLKNFKTAVGQIALADVRGYAVLQKHRYAEGVNAGAVAELYWLEPWCWVRDGFHGDFYYNGNSQFGVGLGSCQAVLGEGNRIGGAAMPRSDFVIREAESPLYELALIAFVNWLMGRRDFAMFVEIFGLPNAVAIMPPNLPPGKELEYQAAAERVARGASGALPHGADVKFPTAQARGESPFEKFCEAQEKDVVLAGTAGHLTMLSLPTGIGKGASKEHDDAWQKIALAKAMRINETLQRDFDAPELAEAFPGAPVCVEFALSIKDEEDVGHLLDSAVKAESIGLQTDAAEISERSGLKLTRIQPSPTDAVNRNHPNPAGPLTGVALKDGQRNAAALVEGMKGNKPKA
jgi:hypothetical protein